MFAWLSDWLAMSIAVRGARRSGKWPAVRDAHLKEHPYCEACGRATDLNVHHIVPVHVQPALELEPMNLMTLCERKTWNCHLWIGHNGNWRDYRRWPQEAARRARLALSLLPLLLVLFSVVARAQNEHAVVRISSHGGSGTVIETREGKSLVLSCAHMFRGPDRYKRMRFDMPSPQPGPAQRIESRVLAVDHHADLALLELDVGPLPYVCPVAPAGHRCTACLSVGYDNMRLPPQKRSANITGHQGHITWTREPPWHGRSGGALIDRSSGYLVGVVSGYVNPRSGPGVYASHGAILSFLGRSSQPQTIAAQPVARGWRPQPLTRQPISRPPACGT